jgi:hypothetical protein
MKPAAANIDHVVVGHDGAGKTRDEPPLQARIATIGQVDDAAHTTFRNASR